MRQRVMIAMAVACDPKILIADEPTTALDVTIQAAILDLMRELRVRLGTAVILITHNLGVVADLADRVVVMYAGRRAEEAPVHELFAHPQHPYTIGLLSAIPRLGEEHREGAKRPRLQEIPGRVPSLAELPQHCAFAPRCPRADELTWSQVPELREVRRGHFVACFHPGRRVAPVSAPVLEVAGLKKHFPVGSQLSAARESSTRSTVSRSRSAQGRCWASWASPAAGSRRSPSASCACSTPTDGEIRLEGREITSLSRRKMRPLRRQLHMVFQDPYSSLNPRMTSGDIVAEPIRLHRLARGRERRRLVAEIFDSVGLREELQDRYPHELSGGQRQRVGLARSLVLHPSLLIADEPVSALDVSVQAAILNLISDLQAEMGFSCLFITHDLSTVEFLCDRVAVMYLGQIVEVAARAELFSDPKHPYTQALLSAAVVPDPEVQRARTRVLLEGEVPSPMSPPSGCRFRTRCPLEPESAPRSHEEEPPLREVNGRGHLVACHLVQPGGDGPKLVDVEAELA